MSSFNSGKQTAKRLILEGLNNRVILAVLDPPGVTRGGLNVAHFKLTRRDGDYARTGFEFVGEVKEWDRKTINEAVKDTEEGYWDLKAIEVRPIVNAVVIGENPDLKYMHGAPEFGDVLLIGQMASAEYHSFHKLGADTTPANEVLVRNLKGDRHLSVRRNQVILATEIKDVIGVVARYSDLQDWSNRGNKRTGESFGPSA